MKKIYISVILALVTAVVIDAYAQEPLVSPRKDDVTIGNTKIKRESTDIVVDYQILLGDEVLSCYVDVVLNIGGKDGIRKVLRPNDLEGDFGRIRESGKKQLRYNVDKDKHLLAGKDISLTLEVRRKEVVKDRILAMASLGVTPQMSYGLMMGYVKKFGGYAKFRSNFRFNSSSYSCDSSGKIDGGGYIWTSGMQRKNRMQITAGVLYRAMSGLYPYAGFGYGSRELHWEDFESDWAKVTDYSCRGLAAEAGLIYNYGPLAISAGVSTTAFRFTELELGIGVMF